VDDLLCDWSNIDTVDIHIYPSSHSENRWRRSGRHSRSLNSWILGDR
jgi:hypothetical protein